MVLPPAHTEQALKCRSYYNPIVDNEGKVVKVVKFATDITRAIEASEAAKATVSSARTSSNQTERIAQEGLEHLHKVISHFQHASDTLGNAQELISALNNQAEQVNKTANTIAQIASQTHLFSLNAAVEAARAGEQGRGFAVVANEVRQLARGSSEAVNEITRVLKENSALVLRTTEAMQRVVEQGHTSQTSVQEIESIVNEILQGAQSVSHSIERLTLEAAGQTKSLASMNWRGFQSTACRAINAAWSCAGKAARRQTHQISAWRPRLRRWAE